MNLDLPPEIAGEVQTLVQAGQYPDARTAVIDLIKTGLEHRSDRDPSDVPDTPDLPDPSEPGGPQGLPDDVNWM